MAHFNCRLLFVRLQLQGSIMVGSLFQVFVGFSGLIGLFMRFIGPLTIAPTISLIGLSLYDSAGTNAGYHWGISIMWVAFPNKGYCRVWDYSAKEYKRKTNERIVDYFKFAIILF